MREYALFSGCLVYYRLPQFESAAIKVLERFKIKLKSLEDVSCCPEPLSMQVLNPKAWYTIAARNICLAEKEGLDLITLCNGCNATLFRVNEDLKTNDELRMKINEYLKKIGKKFEGTITVKSILRVLYEDVGLEEIKGHIKKNAQNAQNVKAAVHYGCHIFDEIKHYDNPKNPVSLKNLVKAVGANVVSYPSEMLCCAAFARYVNEELSLQLVEEKLNDLINVNADCLVVLCPYCFLQYELGQISASRKLNTKFQIPILYYPQLLGLAMGFTARDMGLQFHRVKTDELVEMIRN